MHHFCLFYECKSNSTPINHENYKKFHPKTQILFHKKKIPISLAETANWAQSGKHQFWSEPSEILNLRSSTTPETVAFTPP